MPVASLTPREIQIARFRSQGLRSKEIARELGLAVKTIEMNVYRIQQKLKVKTHAQFLRIADQMKFDA